MSTFLQLVQSLRREAGVSGADPITCQGQTGEMLRLVNWINSAWMDIQRIHTDWQWMRQKFSFQTNIVTNQQIYNAATDCGIVNFGDWKKDSLRIYTTSIGFSNEMILPFAPYDEFRNLYMYGSNRTNYMRPSMYSIDPQKNLVLGGPPDLVGYTINGEFYQVATPLIADSDVPLLDVQYHDMIVWKALMKYGEYEAAEEALARGKSEYKTLLAGLQANRLRQITFGESLA
ncbi:MAG: hypothetical protein JO171_18375 [Paludibacterium sp.]|uniref:phage adaptor protein n=1 Tax=Paludibacterium sp. TaxID=1917523 RepID=UPI0025E7A7A7|nr:hypothetical protein [Paludibacterium sp.]MBV8049120.1 hypothetical protein [Paludibacterium sp.]